ncbi:MAG: DUF4136 domain-containing protein [Halioglobus sp.]|nr:DUF4136 domain-containing protein [Halioglobus sp.]
MRTPHHPILQYITLVIAALFLSACASGPPKPVVDYKQDYDFSAVQQIGFYSDSGEVVGDNPLLVSDMQRERIREALRQALEGRGFEMVEDAADADLLLSWHLLTEQKTDVRTWNTPSFGYGIYYGRYNRYAGYSCWGCLHRHTEVTVYDYTQGTFIVDLIDPDMGKSVWRAVTKSRLKRMPSENQRDYDEAADAIFASFPPSPRAAE